MKELQMHIKSKEKSYEIAVVFDNSGSMYDNESWSRAKYAMEVFAAMLNEGDVLKIFPMHPVTTDGKTKSGGSTSPIVVKSKSDISKISNTSQYKRLLKVVNEVILYKQKSLI